MADSLGSWTQCGKQGRPAAHRVATWSINNVRKRSIARTSSVRKSGFAGGLHRHGSYQIEQKQRFRPTI